MARLTRKMIAAIQEKGVTAMAEGKPQPKDECDFCGTNPVENSYMYEYIQNGDAYLCEMCAFKLGLIW